MNSEINLSNCCRTCLRLGWPLTPINAEDTDAVTFSFKLLSCITEIAWSRIDSSSLICDQCIEQLRISYDFRNTCITADETLQKYVKQSQVETKDNILFDSKYHISNLPKENTNNSRNFPVKHFLDSKEDLGKNEAILSQNEMSFSSRPEDTGELFINNYNQLQTIEEIIIQGTPDEIKGQNKFILRDKEEYSTQEPNTNIDNTKLRHIEEEKSSNEEPNTEKNSEFEVSNSIDDKSIVLAQFGKLSGSSAGERITDQKKRASLTIQQKIDILDKLENGQKNRSICEEYNLSNSTVSTILKKKHDIRKLYIELQNTHGNPKRRKTNRSPALKILDEAVYRWVRQERECGKLIMGITLQEKARAFYALLKENGQIPDGTAEFKATNGWLRNFYERHGIRNLQLKSANQGASQSFIEEFKQLLIEKNIGFDDVYNADETGLLYRSLPNRTLVLADEKEAAGDKPMKERLTVMVCANAGGSHKIPPLVIGKSLKPRCFKNKTIPLDYVGQKKAWMTSEVFLHWFKDVFLKNVREIKPNVKILLVLDNAPTHPCAEDLRRLDKNCEIVYLPPNVTSLIQPMDQGVISALKRHYKTAFLREVNSRQFDDHNAVIEFVKSWDVLACMSILKDAWISLTERTLRNAWKKLLPDIASNAIEVTPLNNELVRLLDRVPGGNSISSREVNDWLLEEDTVPTFEELSDHQIVESVIAPEQLADVKANTKEEDTSLSVSENEDE